MRRFFTLVALLLFALPLGLSTTGCVTQVANYCNDAGYGPLTSSIYQVTISPSQADVGISLAYGQEGQVTTPKVTNCKAATISAGAPTYGSSNLNLADISPTGSVCGGTWNRLSAGGIPDFTICTPPTAPGYATLTASVGGVVSNPVTVYVHPPISAITLTAPTSCIAPGQPGPDLISETSVFSQDGENLPTGTGNVIGTITYTANTPSIVTINDTSINANVTGTQLGANLGTNGTTIANQPGGTVLTATIAGSATNAAATSSAAGYFYTCPPASIALTLPSSTNATSTNGDTIISAGNPQTITSVLTSIVPPGGGSAVAIVPTSGAGPDYTSTQPTQITVSAAGLVSSAFPGTATITGICQPGVATSSTTTASTTSSTTTGESCNPTPLNVLGTFGTGLPIVANPIVVQSPGTENTLLWAASPNSQYFTPFDLSLSTTGSPILLPYVPNSMVLDPTGSDLYFGSYREIMIYSAATNAIAAQDTTVPGVVLAVSPANNQVVVADQLRQVIYLYTPAAPSTTAGGATTVSSSTSIGGLATHAVYSQDGKNVYVVGPTTLFVHNVVSGWSQYPLANANATTSCTLNNDGTTPFCSPDLAITVPSVAVFLTGSTVNARSFCPDTTASPVDYNPMAATVTGDAADHLAATGDGTHILGANTTTLFDIESSTSNTSTRVIAPTGPCPGVVSTAGALPIATTLKQLALTNITPTQIDQVLASPDSSKAFITYTAAAASGLLPMYTPSTTAGATGTLANIQLAAGALAPIAGVFSPDSTQFFVSTTGDNLIHEVDTGTSADTLELNPLLTDSNGGAVPAQFLVSKPRPTT